MPNFAGMVRGHNVRISGWAKMLCRQYGRYPGTNFSEFVSTRPVLRVSLAQLSDHASLIRVWHWQDSRVPGYPGARTGMRKKNRHSYNFGKCGSFGIPSFLPGYAYPGTRVPRVPGNCSRCHNGHLCWQRGSDRKSFSILRSVPDTRVRRFRPAGYQGTWVPMQDL
eukprot:3643315-Rhodomonas_salina.2